MSEDSILALISHLAEGWNHLTQSIHHYHVSGFADWRGTLFPGDSGGEAEVDTLEAQIDDTELREAFRSVRKQVQEMIRVDERIVRWLAEYTGPASLDDKRARSLLERRLHAVTAEGPAGPKDLSGQHNPTIKRL